MTVEHQQELEDMLGHDVYVDMAAPGQTVQLGVRGTLDVFLKPSQQGQVDEHDRVYCIENGSLTRDPASSHVYFTADDVLEIGMMTVIPGEKMGARDKSEFPHIRIEDGEVSHDRRDKDDLALAR
jgi:hypothetical protein